MQYLKYSSFLLFIKFVFLTICFTGYVSANGNLSIDEFSDDLNIVISPTRLKQSISDTPASITIIDFQTIHDLGIREIPEALRLVPGMAVALANGNDWRINYHGANGLNPRRMQVMIDGLPVYQSGFAEIDWKTIGISINDVDRIEVTRSPNSASYGSNSFQAVINIISKHPNKTQGWKIQGQYGDLKTRDAYLSYGGRTSNASFRTSLFHRQDDGYDLNVNGDDRRDFTKSDQLTIRSITNLSNDSALEIGFGALDSTKGREFVEPNEQTKPDVGWQQVNGDVRWKKQSAANNEIVLHASHVWASLDQHWESCYPEITLSPELRALELANPGYVDTMLAGGMPSGGTPEDDALAFAVLTKLSELGAQAFAPLCVGDVNQDAKDQTSRFELQNTHVFSNDFKVVGGVGLSHDDFYSETYTNGRLTDTKYYAFSNAEYDFSDFVLNGGLFADYANTRSNKLDIAPRIALNYHFDQRNTVKAVISKGIRTPDFLETDRNWNYFIRDFKDGSPDRYFYQHAESNEELKSEKIISHELIYYGNFPDSGVRLDVKLFHERLYDLISERLQFADYHPTNNGEVTLNGAETEIHYLPTNDLHLGATYAYIDSDTDVFFEKMLYARHSGSVFTTYKLAESLTGGLAYFGTSNAMGSSFDRYELTLTKSFNESNRERSEVMFKIAHQPQDAYVIRTETYKHVNKFTSDTFLNCRLTMHF